MPESSAQAAKQRSVSIDVLRGLVMVIMALDHTRDFFTSTGMNPGFSDVSAGVFLTRWITHLCAPVFMFLAGSGAALSLGSGKSRSQLSRFLWTRGLWIIFLELTVVCWAWAFSFSYQYLAFGVLWALGWSMVFLSVLTFLPVPVIATVGSVMVFGHNLFDGVKAGDLGGLSWLWLILHERGTLFASSNHLIKVIYPLIPWLGVMALGYVFGGFWNRLAAQRGRLASGLGVLLLTAFIIVRGINRYGDPSPWVPQQNFFRTLLSFINCQKYPPSLDYLLVTMGIAFLLLAAFEAFAKIQWKPLQIFGRVPLFYYLIHLYLIHAAALVVAFFTYGSLVSLDILHVYRPKGYGHSLGFVYLTWIVIVLTLYPLCRWFAGVKKNSKNPWLSYL